MKFLQLIKEEVTKKIFEEIDDRDREYMDMRRKNQSWEGSNLKTDLQGKEATVVLLHLKEKFDVGDDINVYDIYPVGTWSYMTHFEIDNDEFSGMSFICGDEEDTYRTAVENTKEMLEDDGLSNLKREFLIDHINRKKLRSDVYDLNSDMVYDDPDSWIDDDSLRSLSYKQMNTVDFYNDLIGRIDNQIRYLESHDDELDKTTLQREIQALSEKITFYENKITEIESNPQGDYPSDVLQTKAEELTEHMMDDVWQVFDDWGYDIARYVDVDSVARDIVDMDGVALSLPLYDGTLDEYRYNGNYYFVGRVD